MTLTKEQLAELTELMNERRREFALDRLFSLSPGEVRLAYDVIDEWQNAQIEAEMGAHLDWQSARYDKGYERGFEAGRESMRRELMPASDEADPLDDDTDVDPGPDFDGGFYTRTPDGHTIHINGDPNMSEETAQALRELADKVSRQLSKTHPAPDDPAPITEPPQADILTGQAWSGATPPGSAPSVPFGAGSAGQAVGMDDDYELEDDPYPPAPLSNAEGSARAGDEIMAALPDEPMPMPVPLRSPIGPKRDALTSPAEARENIAQMLAAANGEPQFDLTPGHRKTQRVLDKALPKGRGGNVLPAIDQLVALCKEIAMAGVMPTMAAFDVAKPPNWSTAQSHLTRLNTTWTALGEKAGLAPNPRNKNATEPT